MKYILFGLILSLFYVEIFQEKTNLLEIRRLEGAFETPASPFFDLKEFFNGTWQEKFNTYYEKKLLVHPFLVRIRNQMAFSLFGEINTYEVVRGEKNILYQHAYINALLGKDFIGEEKIKEKIDRLEFVQNEFKKHNVDLIYVIAPGKASYLPEFLPEEYKAMKPGKTNYKVFMSNAEAKKLNVIDFRKYFLQLKDTVKHPLFPKTGTHWSGYGITIVADSLFKFMEHLSKHDIGSIKIEPGYSTNDSLRYTDEDISKAMNLLFPIKPFDMYYPSVKIFPAGHKKSNLLSVGDSFTQSLFFFYPFVDSLFSDSSVFWSYNKVVSYPEKGPDWKKNVTELNFDEQIKDRNYILIVSTEINLVDIGFGFLEKAEEYLLKNRKSPQQIYNEVLTAINNDKAWLNSIKEKASKNHVAFQRQLKTDIIWFVENKKMVDQQGLEELKNR